MLSVFYNDILLADRVQLAGSFFQRFMGLMGKAGLEAREGLLLKNCSSVHCFFMRFPIDVVYLSSDLRVLDVETIRPWHLGRFVKDARHVLELPAGEGLKLIPGSQISIK